MTTKIEITITENDDVVFVYMYKEQALLHKFSIPKKLLATRSKEFAYKICEGMGKSLTKIIQSIIEGGN